MFERMDELERDESYFGESYTNQQCEQLAVERIDRRYWARERELFDTKWFDYWRLHPLKATYLFASEYRKAYRRMMCRREGIEKGQYRRGFKGEDFLALSSREYHGFWRARQKADSLGIPYDVYCAAAMRWANDRLWKRLPRPVQMYSDAIVEYITEFWGGRLAAAIRVPVDEYFTAEHYEGADVQRRFETYMLDQIASRSNPVVAIANFVIFEEVVRASAAVERFGPEMVRRARSVFP